MINIFISYSHQDEKWKDVLISQMKILGVESQLSISADRPKEGRDAWSAEIEAALKKADVAVLLISADYLTSGIIINKEIPLLLELSEKERLKIIPVIVKPCPWKMVSWLSRLPVFPGDGTPLESINKYQLEDELTKLISKITKLKSKYEIKLPRRSEEENLIGYRVTITPTGKENLFEICWFDLSTGTEDCFMQAGPGFAAPGIDRWWQNQAGALNSGRELFKFLDGDVRHLQRALAAADQQGEPLLLQLKTSVQTADWPFELLAHEESFLLPHRLHLVRLVSEWGAGMKVQAQDHPLKLLFMACSPLNVGPELDFEKEEETILHITAKLPIEMEVEDSGTLEGLRERLLQDRYDVVHLSGHADIDEKGQPYFIMEDETGREHRVSPDILWGDALIENPPRLLFLSGCYSGGTLGNAVFSFSYNLVENYNVPTLLEWGRSVGYRQTIHAEEILYRELSRGKSILEAVQRTRYELITAFAGDPFPAWGLLRLFGWVGALVPMVKAGQKAIPKARRMIHVYLEQSRVKVLKEGFVGRRRQLQHSLRALKQSQDKIGVLLLGTAGLGKSSLAGKICERFTRHTLIIIHGIFNAVTLDNALKDAFILALDEEGKRILGHVKKAVDKLADLCVSCFKKINYLILLDDFDQNLEGAAQGKPGPLMPEAAELLGVLLKYLPYSGKETLLIITSRYGFSLADGQGGDAVAERLERVWLTGFQEAEQRKKARELPFIYSYQDSLVREQLLAAGLGNPRLMEWLDTLVGQMSREEVSQLLAAVRDKQEEFIRGHVIRELLDRGGESLAVFMQWFGIYRSPVGREGARLVAEKAGLADWEELLARGMDLSLVEHLQAQQGYSVTPLLRGELAAGLAGEKLIDGHAAAFAYYKAVCEPMGDDMDPLLVEEWIYHALACGEEEVASRQGGRLVKYLRKRLAFLESRRMGEWVLLEKKRKQPGLSTGDDALLLNETAVTIQDLGDYRKAIDYYQQALTIVKKVHGEEHQDVATTLNKMGEAWAALGNHRKAIDYFQQALAIDRAVFGEQHPHVARELNNLGEVWRDLGDTKKAIDYYQQALTINRAVFGEQHPHVAIRLNNLGLAWADLGDHIKAIDYYQQALITWKNVYGENHPQVAIGLNNLGLAWRNLGDPKKAIDYYQRALTIDRAVFGEQHPNVARELNNLGDAWRNLGDPIKAIDYLEQALTIDRAVFGEQHPDVARALNNLGRAYFDLGQKETAKGYLEKAHAIYNKFFGEVHPHTKNTAKGLEKCSRD